MKQVRIFSTIVILIFLILAGCGGGGGGGSSSDAGSSNASNNSNTDSNSGNTAKISLAWDAATSSNIAGYKVHYGTSSGNYSTVIDVGDTTTCTISSLQDGVTYYLAVTDYDTFGDESGFSNEISGTAR